MTDINRQLEQLLNFWLDFVHYRLCWIAETEARAAQFGTYGSNGEFDPERTARIIQGALILDRLVAIGGTVAFRPA